MSSGTCKLDNQGRIVTPSTWRVKQGIQPGEELIVLEEDGRLIVQTRAQAIAEAQAIVRRATAGRVSLTDELLAERRRERLQEAGSAPKRRKL